MIEKKIDTDIEGIIQELNLSESEVLYPLFEATVNSIQSIHERCNENILEPQKKAIGEGENSIYNERDKD